MKAKLVKKDSKPVQTPAPAKTKAAPRPAGPAVDPRIQFANLFRGKK
jgi:hypothetical protein